MDIKEKMNNAINEWPNKSRLTFLMIVLLGSIAAVMLFDISQSLYYKSKYDQSKYYVESSFSLYKLSNECINTYYINIVDDNGNVFITGDIPENCSPKFIENYTQIIYAEQSKEDLDKMANAIMVELDRVDANAIQTNSALLKDKSDGSVVNDFTKDLEKEHEQRRAKKSNV